MTHSTKLASKLVKELPEAGLGLSILQERQDYVLWLEKYRNFLLVNITFVSGCHWQSFVISVSSTSMWCQQDPSSSILVLVLGRLSIRARESDSSYCNWTNFHQRLTILKWMAPRDSSHVDHRLYEHYSCSAMNWYWVTWCRVQYLLAVPRLENCTIFYQLRQSFRWCRLVLPTIFMELSEYELANNFQ